MSDLINDSIRVINGDIVIGNHDSIILLGVQPQNKLRDFSKNMSKMLIESNIDLDITISEVIYEIEKFIMMTTTIVTPKRLVRKYKQHKDIRKEYYKILSYLEKVTLYFQLQQVQLIKEIKILESLDIVINESKTELVHCIENGSYLLQSKEARTVKKNENEFPFGIGQDDEEWFLRLERRIEDLKISYSISLQNQVQIKMLYDNNLLLIDKIAATILNTIPIWRNQMSILLGIELLENRLSVQNKILQITEDYINQRSRKARKKNKLSHLPLLDTKKILTLNERLKVALSEMASIEDSDENIRKDFQKVLF